MGRGSGSAGSTTASLRSAAWDAQKSGNFSSAASLYRKALAKYPKGSMGTALGRRDVATLKEAARVMDEFSRGG